MSGGPRSRVAMPERDLWEFVADAHTGIFTTLRADGVPVALPVWFACLDRTVYVRTRGRKVTRVRHDPRASFLVEDGTRWAELRAVHLTGTADVVELDAGTHRRFLAELDRKYAGSRGRQDGRTQAHYAALDFVIVRFRPDQHVLSWDNARIATASGT